MSNKLNLRDLVSYSLLALPLAFVGMPLYIYVPDFYFTQTSLSLTTAAFILLAIRLLDAFIDPFIGIISDNFANMRKLILITGMTILAVSIYMIFHPIHNYVLAWFFASIFLATFSFSLLTINLNSIGSLWSQNTLVKTRITTWRESFGLIGFILASVAPAILGLYFPVIKSFHYFSIIQITILIITGILFLHRLKSYTTLHDLVENISLKNIFKIYQNNHSFFNIYGLSMLASSIPAVLVISFIRDQLQLANKTGLFLLCYFLSAVIAAPFWNYMAKNYTKPNVWLYAMLSTLIPFSYTFLLRSGDTIPFALICLLSGAALSAELILPPSILSDLIDRNNMRSTTSIHFSLLTFLSKFGLAAGSALALIILGYSNFKPGNANSSESLEYLRFTYALLPCFIKAIAAFMLWNAIKSLKFAEHHD